MNQPTWLPERTSCQKDLAAPDATARAHKALPRTTSALIRRALRTASADSEREECASIGSRGGM